MQQCLITLPGLDTPADHSGQGCPESQNPETPSHTRTHGVEVENSKRRTLLQSPLAFLVQGAPGEMGEGTAHSSLGLLFPHRPSSALTTSLFSSGEEMGVCAERGHRVGKYREWGTDRVMEVS